MLLIGRHLHIGPPSDILTALFNLLFLYG